VWRMDPGTRPRLFFSTCEPAQDTFCLVGTSRAKVKQYEHKWLGLPLQKVRESVEVKLFAREGEVCAGQERRAAGEKKSRHGGRN
jgi:hypothetical protein